MNPDDAYDRILASLYRAARDDAHWLAASALIEEACGAVGNFLVVGEGYDYARIDFARLLYRGEDRRDLAQEYFETYFPQDEAPRRRMALREGVLAPARALYTEDELKTSAAYNEGWRRLGGQDGLTVHFGAPEELRMVWVLGDPAGGDGWESGRVRLVERLLPHFREFIGLRQALAAADALGAGLGGLLDNDRIGVVQLDRAGRVLAANAPALAVLRRGDGLLDRDGTLDARLSAERDRLHRLVGRALPDFWGGRAPGGGSMTVGRASGRSRLGLHVSPVGDGSADFGGRRVAALVLVVDPERRPRIDARRVAATLGLTASEGRAAALLAEGRSVLEIAAVTGWQAGYVRRLLKRIYKKQGVSGQVSLVPRVLALEALPRG